MTNRIKIFAGLFLLLVGNFNLQAQNNTFPTTGNVGIGTNSPEVKLHVNHSGTGQAVILAHGGDINFRLVTRQDQAVNDNGSILTELGMEYGTARNTGIRFHRGASATGGFMSFTTDAGYERMRINTYGNVGIGTSSPGHKLDVIGTVRAREVKVDMLGADFVFEEDYGLMPLAELEAFIKANKHLPEIESAVEMEADGVELGELNSKLLQKIEELTLYLIDINKQLKVQNEKVERLELENNSLRKKISEK